MKRMILIAAAFLIVFSAAACAESNAVCPAYCKGVNFVDENSDGVCDHFVDADGDGVCDGQHERGCARCRDCFADENADGICDHCRQRTADGKVERDASVRHNQHRHGRAHGSGGRHVRAHGAR